MFRAIGIFFVVLVMSMLIVSSIARGALKAPEMAILRYIVLSSCVAVSVLSSYLDHMVRSRGTATIGPLKIRDGKISFGMGESGEPVSLPQSPNSTSNPAPAITTNQSGAQSINQSSNVSANESAGESAPTVIPEAIQRAASQAIVFRQHMPPKTGKDRLSFWGGLPIAPPSFKWPVVKNREGQDRLPTFIMQVKCADIPEQGWLGLMPSRGVIYFFVELQWGDEVYRVVYHPETTGLAEITAPPELEPAYGEEAKYNYPWCASGEYPKTLLKWTFDPVFIAMPDATAEMEPGEPSFWPCDDKAAIKELLRAQHEEITHQPIELKDISKADGSFIKPYPAYPHDWNCIRTTAALVGERLGRNHRDDKDDAIAADSAVNAANKWVDTANKNDLWAAVPEAEASVFIEWLSHVPRNAHYALPEAIAKSIEQTIEASHSERVALDAALLKHVWHRHALACIYKDGPVTNGTPDRMLAAPCDVQGNQYEIAQTHLLLFEMSSYREIEHYFGEGVYQFWITPEDLKQRRFDKVVMTTDAY